MSFRIRIRDVFSFVLGFYIAFFLGLVLGTFQRHSALRATLSEIEELKAQARRIEWQIKEITELEQTIKELKGLQTLKANESSDRIIE